MLAAAIVTGLVAFLHLYFMVLEMFLWTMPYGRRVFGLSLEFAMASRSLAANQGLYNGFMAAGLIWGLYLGAEGRELRIFFLSCMVLAGVFGGFTANHKILLVQALPAAIGLGLVLTS